MQVTLCYKFNTMTHTYKITGMTCISCESKVQELFSKIDGVTNVNVNWQLGEAKISMQKHINNIVFQEALKGTKFQLTQKQEILSNSIEEQTKPWFQLYKPVWLLFTFITGIAFLAQVNVPYFSWMIWLNHFMAGFFLAFSFFKLLNLRGFADSYATYDVIAKRWRAYGFIYAFMELVLGIAFLTGYYPLFSNMLTFVVMSISLIGVLQSVLNKRKIRCACLGDVFNLPMSTITIIEDGLMIFSSLFMIVYLSI
jgi:cation transport ATPase